MASDSENVFECVVFKDRQGKEIDRMQMRRLERRPSSFVTLENGPWSLLVDWTSVPGFLCYRCWNIPPDVKSPSFFPVFTIKDCGHVICEECIPYESTESCSSCNSRWQCMRCNRRPRDTKWGVRGFRQVSEEGYICVDCLKK